MKKSLNTIAIAIALFLTLSYTFAQSPKGKYGTFALTHATVYTVTKGIINNGTVIIRNGKIEAVGTNITIPSGAEVIDCKGQFIYPGMIDSGTRLGLVEVSSDPRTIDFNEVGDVVPQMKALTAVNPNSALIPVTRVSGVTTVISNPEGSMFPGTAALINLHGYTPDQMFAGFEGVVLNFPNTGRRGFWDRRTDDEIKKATDKAMEKLNDVWDKATQYHKLDSATNGKGVGYYPELQALLPVLRGKQTLLIEANASKDITAALKWIKEKKIKKVVLTGVLEGWRVADEIAKAGIPVIAGPVQAVPSREYDRYDRAYANPGLLRKAGVKVALQTGQAENVRNLPYHAAYAAAYGMGQEEALKAVTIVPAEIFGVADKLGSIEVGKSATLFICDGDPFETKTNIKHVFIDGWQIPMVSRQTQLYDEFLQRDPGVNKAKQ
ncbi:MAG: amidohydrolase family protein [Cyclobacteriaceae bacterium]|nr:amidohydrolase family protein [Cytophagales bacterium]MCZ8328876.1 amidohydrolase family protein [Cyclobacteriaceae bacterium]